MVTELPHTVVVDRVEQGLRAHGVGAFFGLNLLYCST